MQNRALALSKEKPPRKNDAPIILPVKPKARYRLEPWSWHPSEKSCSIEAYCEISGKREIVAEIVHNKNVEADYIAGLITHAVNDYEKMRELIWEMVRALELCLTCDLNWEAEFEADAVLRKIVR